MENTFDNGSLRFWIRRQKYSYNRKECIDIRRVDKSLVSYLLILFLTFVIVVQLLSHVQLFATLWTAAGQASLSFTVSWALLKFMSIESVIVSNQLILCCPLLLPSSISQHQSLFQGVGSSHQVAKMLNLQLQHQSFQWIFRVDSL